jgi:hypothetical protein
VKVDLNWTLPNLDNESYIHVKCKALDVKGFALYNSTWWVRGAGVHLIAAMNLNNG